MSAEFKMQIAHLSWTPVIWHCKVIFNRGLVAFWKIKGDALVLSTVKFR